MRFGRLVAIEPSGFSETGLKMWLCRCDCGKTKEIAHNSLVRGKTRSCGCLRAEGARTRRLKQPIDLKGLRFGTLTAVDLKYMGNRYYWRCQCDCGRQRYVERNELLQKPHDKCTCDKVSEKRKVKTA